MKSIAHDPRRTFGEAVTTHARLDPRVVVLSADSGWSSGFKSFAAEFPNRYFEFGIMEQSVTGIAAGLATTGHTPVFCAIAPFVTSRNFEMFRNDIGYMRQNVKIVGRNGGMSYSDLGATHHSLEDYAIIRMIPGVTVLSPQDAGEIRAAVKTMLTIDGPVYMRIGANAMPDLLPAEEFVIGQGRTVQQGSDATVISTGDISHNVVTATRILAARGIKIEHLGMPTVSPLDQDLILESAARTGLVVTVEEHYIRGGLGGGVCELLSQRLPVPVTLLGIDHDYVHSGSYSDLLTHHGLTAESIADSIEGAISHHRTHPQTRLTPESGS